jgi:hypothetical protein
MKTTKHWVWTMSALAVLATPLAHKHFKHELNHHHAYRSIASDEVVPTTFPNLTRLQATLVQQNNTVINVTVNDPEVIKKLNEDIKAEQEKAKLLQTQLGESQSSLAQSLEQNTQNQARIKELEEAVKVHVTRISELEAQVKSMEASAQVNAQELEATKLALTEAKTAAEAAVIALDEANKKVAEARVEIEKRDAIIAEREAELKKKNEEILKKEAEIAEREERLAHKREELRKQKEKHDIFVCESEFKFTALTKQIEELNDQQKQFTQVMLGLNQVLLGFMGQMNQQGQQGQQGQMGQGYNYFNQGYMPSTYAMGQVQTPWQNAVSGQYPFNPWMQQQQPQSQVINNYYGGMPQMGVPQMSMQQQAHPLMMQQQSPYYMPGSFNFGMPGVMDGNRSQVEFGNMQTQAPVGQILPAQAQQAPMVQAGIAPQMFN